MWRDNYAQHRTAWPHNRAIRLDGLAGRPAVEHNGWPNGSKPVDVEGLSGNCWLLAHLARQPQAGAPHHRHGHPDHSALFVDAYLIRLHLAQVTRVLDPMLL